MSCHRQSNCCPLAAYKNKPGVEGGEGRDTKPRGRKVRGQSASKLLFPFLLKIDPNTLYIIQKFHSLVAATGKPGPVALIFHLSSRGLGPREQWLGPGGCP